MNPITSPGRDTHVSRRAVLDAAAVAALAVPLRPAPALSSPARSGPDADGILDWINHPTDPLRGTDPDLPSRDLHPLERIVRGAVIVGLGESAHGTHDQFALKHRITRHLVEHGNFGTPRLGRGVGFWVAIDRYINGGTGDPAAIVNDAGFNLQNAAMLELMTWLHHRNLRRPPQRRVRFLAADVVQLRDLQFTELERHVAAVEPSLTPVLMAHLEPLRIQHTPGYQIYWYRQLSHQAQHELVSHARAVLDLVHQLPNRPSTVCAQDAEMHALTLVGFYESYTREGERTDVRDAYIAQILHGWRRTHRRRIIYSAANAHTAATSTQTISFPPNPPTERALAGGRLRAHYGDRNISVGLTFDHGTILAGWDTGHPRVFPVPAPPTTFVDHLLGQATRDDYILGLRGHHSRAVRRWLAGRGTLRVIGGAAYNPAHDRDYYMAMDRWGHGFDAVVHLDSAQASRLPECASVRPPSPCATETRRCLEQTRVQRSQRRPQREHVRLRADAGVQVTDRCLHPALALPPLILTRRGQAHLVRTAVPRVPRPAQVTTVLHRGQMTRQRGRSQAEAALELPRGERAGGQLCVHGVLRWQHADVAERGVKIGAQPLLEHEQVEGEVAPWLVQHERTVTHGSSSHVCTSRE